MKATNPCLPLLFLAVSAAFAETKTWNASAKTRGYWDDPAKWTPAGVPGPDDDVVIGTQSYCHISNSVSMASLTLRGYACLEVAARASATDPKSAAYTGCSADIAANDAPLSIAIAGDVSISGGARWLIGAQNHRRNTTLAIGGDLSFANATSTAQWLAIFAGQTNATVLAEDGGAWVTVGGATTLAFTTGKASSSIVPLCHQNSGVGVVFHLQDLSIDSGCSINASTAGYRCLAEQRYAGPGTPVTSTTLAGSYGGRGLNYGTTYGSPSSPWQAGSGSYYSASKAGSTGGGSIRVTARDVVLDGSLLANGGGESGFDSGAGGGIWLACRSLAGTGLVQAHGGVNTRAKAYNRYCGGGGRIALDVERPVDDGMQLVLDAAAGSYYTGGFTPSVGMQGGEVGTIWSNQRRLLERAYARCRGGAFHCPEFGATYIVPVTAIPAKAAFYFPTVSTLVFTNDLLLSQSSILGCGALGTPANLATHSANNINATADWFLRDDDGPVDRALAIHGSLTMETNSWLLVNGRSQAWRADFRRHSAVTIDGDFHQGGGLSVIGNMVGDAYGYDWKNPPVTFSVGGSWTMASNALTSARCESITGGPVHFRVGRAFTSEPTSTFTANYGGYYVTNSYYLKYEGSSQAPGRPIYSSLASIAGGAYGGTASTSASRYGAPFMPFRPGSHSGTRQDAGYQQCPGGGVIFLQAGSARFGGVFTANGIRNPDYSGRGSSSGGAICVMLSSSRLAVSSNAVFSAKGGSGNSNSHAGGGGRIAIGLRMRKADIDREIDHLLALGDPRAECAAEPVVKHARDYTAEERAALFPDATFTAAGGNGVAGTEGSVVIYEAIAPGTLVLLR